jgi:multidrug efflux pump subunit AcrA (membrane-fusion protein)
MSEKQGEAARLAGPCEPTPSNALLGLLGYSTDMPRGAVLERAYQDALKFSRSLVGLALLASELQNISSLEALTAESKQRLAAAQGELDQIKARATAAEADQHSAIRELKREAAEEVAARVTRLSQLDADIAVKGAELERLTGELATAQTEHDRVTKAHTEFVARLGALRSGG